MNIAVFGLGYVGIVSAGCLARDGHRVVGVDVLPLKVEMINRGQSPIIEDAIEDIVKAGVSAGRLQGTLDAHTILTQSDMAIVCVGTPSMPEGSLDDSHIRVVISQIGESLRERQNNLLIVVRSTLTPGTMRNVVIPLLENTSGRAVGDGYEVVFHPEFMREGSSVYDYYHPPKIVVGERIKGGGKALLDLYDARFDCPRITCELDVSEMVKYCDNIFHALKITFANEIGQYCHAIGIDSNAVMGIFCQDTKLNISTKYLKPGFAFGGSCLPKDLRAFLSEAQKSYLRLPMLEHMLPSNQHQIARALEMVLQTGAKRIGFYGIAFKTGTDDLRESPLVELAERLLGKGRDLVIYDPKVQMARLIGGNKSFVERKFPHLAQFLTDEITDLEGCELVLLGHPAKAEIVHHFLEAGIALFDLVGNQPDIINGSDNRIV